MLHVGARDFKGEERALFKELGGTIVGAGIIRHWSMEVALEPALRDLRNRLSRIYLHFDLDVLNPANAPANEFAAPDGLTVEQIQTAIKIFGDRFKICLRNRRILWFAAISWRYLC
jgi:arginase family enzyme